MELSIFPITAKTHPKPLKRLKPFTYVVEHDSYKCRGVGILLHFIGFSFGIKWPSGEFYTPPEDWELDGR